MVGSRPVALALAVTSLRGGGAEAVGVAWANELAAGGHAVTVLALSDTDGVEALDAGVDVVDLSGLGHLSRTRRIAREAQSRRLDAVIGLQTYPNLLSIAAARLARPRRWAVVVTEHNLISLGLPGSGRGHRAKIRLARAAYRHADRIVACSHPVAAEMVAAFGALAGRYAVVPNPVLARATSQTRPAASASTEAPAPTAASQTTAPEPTAPDVVDVFVVGRLAPQKRPEVAVDVVAELRRQGVEARLAIVGSGPLHGATTARAASAGVPIVDRGWMPDWTEALSPHAVLLLASSREGLGNVLVEAAAAGVPTVAASTALGVADAVIPGITGVLAADDSVTELARAVRSAAALRVPDVSGWLAGFTVASSTAALLAVTEHAVADRAAR